jgi:hypothetical protein
MEWWIVQHADGGLTQHCADPATSGDPPGARRAKLPRQLDLEVEAWDWAAGKIVTLVSPARARFEAAIDAQREAQRAAVMTQGVGQSYAYAQKAAEVADYRNLLAAVLAALATPQRAARFPFAMAEADATGDSLATVIARFETGIAASRVKIARVEALATKAKRAVRAAATIADMKAAAKIDWSN